MRRNSRRSIKLVVLVAVVIVIVQIYNIEVDENSFSKDIFPPQNRALASNDLVLSTESSKSPWDFTTSRNAIMTHTPKSSDLEETDVENVTQDKMKTSDQDLLNVIEQELKKEDNGAILTEVNGTSHQTTKPTQSKRLFTSENEHRKKETKTEKVTEQATTAEPYLENIKLSEYNDQSDGLHNSAANQALQKHLDILFEESKDIFDLLPNKYLPDYKSFCWYDSLNVFQCLASVYLAGMPKCGTTDLFQKLMWHKELTTQSHHLFDPNGLRKVKFSTEKEYHYWTRGRIGRPKNFLLNPAVPPPKTLFSEFLIGSGAERVESYKDRRIVDGTPSLLWDLGGWETRYPGLDEPPYSNADLIHAVTPDAKILAILRNPTERLYSEYLYFWKGSTKLQQEVRSPQTFHMEVRRETKKFNKCLESNSLRNCCYSSGYSIRLRITLGVYVCYVRDFLEVFGDKFLALTINEYHSNPIKTLTKIFNHIGISIPNTEELQLQIETSETLNESGDIKEEVGEMLDETRELLNLFYGPYNSELAVLLGDSQYLFA